MRNTKSPSVNCMADKLLGDMGASFSFFFISSLLTVVRLGFFQFCLYSMIKSSRKIKTFEKPIDKNEKWHYILRCKVKKLDKKSA